MKNQFAIFRFILCLWVALCSFSTLRGEVIITTSSVINGTSGTGTTWANTSNLSLSATAPGSGAFDKYINSRIIFGIKDNLTLTDNRRIKATVNFTIEYQTSGSSAWTSLGTASLVTEFDKSQSAIQEQDMQIYQTPTGYYNFRISGITLSLQDMTTSTAIASNDALCTDRLCLSLETEVDRYTTMSTTTSVTSLTSGYQSTTDRLRVSWSSFAGAVEYQLEWIYIDNYKTGGIANTIAPANLGVNFRQNAARVTIKSNNYEIPLTYERGWLVYRVRAVGINTVSPYTDRIYNKWSDDAITTKVVSNYQAAMAAYSLTAHEQDKLNWQCVSSYAEDGVRKDVISYYDGAMYNRQSVTRLSSGDYAVVGEQFYDHQGRPAVSALPAPVNDAKLRFYAGFNTNTSNLPYSREDFNKNTTATSCSPSVIGMSTLKGASNYYSPSNVFLTPALASPHEALIPDAKNFPMAVTRYTPDGTGRVSAQGGVGADFQLGSGHETTMYYDTPSQEELDALFGNNVGFASHYTRTTTKDPNGQMSMDYKDAKGNTIATCLAGTPPTSVDALSSAVGAAGTTTNLINSNVADYDSHCFSINRAFTVHSAGTHTVNYELTIPTQSSICYPTNICFDCSYDLEITIKQNGGCNNVLYQKTANVGKVVALDELGQIVPNVTCSSPAVVSYSLATQGGGTASVNLPIGNYTITKRLCVNEQLADAYALYYTTQKNNSCLTTYQTFLDQAIQSIDTTQCNQNCATINDPVYCDPYPNMCETTKRMMLADLTPPSGQYAQVVLTDALNPDGTVSDNYSILKTPGSLTGYPSSGTLNYQNINNVFVTSAGGNTPYQWINPLTGATSNINAAGVPLTAIVSHWQSFWSNSLLPYHPEYCKLAQCEARQTSHEFDAELMATTYASAVSKGWISASGVVFASNPDPLVSTTNYTIDDGIVTPGTPSANTCIAAILGFMTDMNPDSPGAQSMVNAAIRMDWCSDIAHTSGSNCDTTGCNFTTGINSEGRWRAFRALYLSHKQRLLLAKDASLTCTGPAGKEKRFRDFNSIIPAGTTSPYNFNSIWDAGVTGSANSYDNITSAQSTQLLGIAQTMYNSMCTTATPSTANNCNLAGDAESFFDIFFVNHAPLTTTATTFNAATYGLTSNGFFNTIKSTPTATTFTASTSSTNPYNLIFGGICLGTLSTKYSGTLDWNLVGGVRNVVLTWNSASPYSLQYINFDLEYNAASGHQLIPFTLTVSNTCSIASWCTGSCPTLTLTIPNNGSTTSTTNTNNCSVCSMTATTIPPPTIVSCKQELLLEATANAQYLYAQYLEGIYNQFKEDYLNKCMLVTESMLMTLPDYRYHFTLYYYDQSGNLVQTVPPKGVTPYTTAADFTAISNYRKKVAGATLKINDHNMESRYRQNSFNLAFETLTPDGGKSCFLYDVLGRSIAAQDANQVAATPNKKINYMVYDALGRQTEGGEGELLTTTWAISNFTNTFADYTTFKTFVNTATSFKKLDYIATLYDRSPLLGATTSPVPAYFNTGTQDNLRMRVASSLIYLNGATGSAYHNAIHYSYDVHGNVKEIVNDYPGIANAPRNNTQYNYDLISGKVNEAIYLPKPASATTPAHGQFIHKYRYDADNRLIEVQTSRDRVRWQSEAYYSFYKHGPLSRLQLGRMGVQGLDYAYTIQGWIKGVNSASLQPNYDPAQDGLSTAVSKKIARDAMGYILRYYHKDYVSIGTTNIQPNDTGSDIILSSYPNNGLYNGNIASMITALRPFMNDYTGVTAANQGPACTIYRYDQLNRLKKVSNFKGMNLATNQWQTTSASANYLEEYTYDANGNIQTLLRNGSTSTSVNGVAYTPGALAMDNLSYTYYSNTSNKLLFVSDAVAASTYSNTPANLYDLDDIDSQGAGNYTYDNIGQLTKDAMSGITSISWNMQHKLKSVVSNGKTINYYYNPFGQRILKDEAGKQTLYARDAQGNTMSIYEKATTATAFTQRSLTIYGSARIGELSLNATSVNQYAAPANNANARVYTYFLGNRRYELSNHLGNVLMSISDRKLPRANNTISTIPADGTAITFFEADIITANDYYAFGAEMPGRNYTAPSALSYRYGFNGQEKDDEIMGKGNALSFEYRVYDSRLGRWTSVDPLAEKFPNTSPYAFGNNSPIFYVDLDGLQATPYPNDLIGSPNYYQWRYNDFQQRNPGKTAPDYYLNYGDKYIQRFTNETYDLLSEQGRQWLADAREKLQVSIENRLAQPDGEELERDNKAFKEFAFNTHVDAYWNAGLPKLHTVDLVAIVLTPNFTDLTSEDGMKQATDMMDKLANYWLDNPMEGLKRGAELYMNQDKIKVMVTAKAVREHFDPDEAITKLDEIIKKIPTIF